MDFTRLRRESIKKTTFIVMVVFFSLIAISYFCLLLSHLCAAHKTSKILTAAEAIRIGDPSQKFFDAVHGCHIQKEDSEYICDIVNNQLGFAWADAFTGKMSFERFLAITGLLNRLGLRPSLLTLHCVFEEDRVKKLEVSAILAGNNETLGGIWQIAPNVTGRSIYNELTQAEQRTYFSWFHITGAPSGEGIRIFVTPASTEKELQARHINRQCLFSFRGCNNICEVMPEAISVLQERKEKWPACMRNDN